MNAGPRIPNEIAGIGSIYVCGMKQQPVCYARLPKVAFLSHSTGTNSGVVRQRLSFQCVFAVIRKAMIMAELASSIWDVRASV